MSRNRKPIASGLGAVLLLALGLGGVMLAYTRLSGLSPIDQIGDAFRRLASIALSDTAQMGLLVGVCVACGVLVILDRRRRAKARQAAC